MRHALMILTSADEMKVALLSKRYTVLNMRRPPEEEEAIVEIEPLRTRFLPQRQPRTLDVSRVAMRRRADYFLNHLKLPGVSPRTGMMECNCEAYVTTTRRKDDVVSGNGSL